MDDLLTRRVKIGVQYIGTKYCGWQSQKNAVSVQELVEKALGGVLGHEVRLTASGRTDEGVHARRQVAHFDTDVEIKPFNLILGANVRLPDDIAVVDAEYTDNSFDARRDAKRKTYVYRMYVDSVRRPFLDVNHLQIYRQPDLSAMNRAAAALVGRHDFKCFCATGGNANTFVREIFSCDVRQEGNIIEISVCGNAFLYNMVRIMAGTLYETAIGHISPDSIPERLASRNRRLMGRTAPPEGLYLNRVFYDDGEIPGYHGGTCHGN